MHTGACHRSRGFYLRAFSFQNQTCNRHHSGSPASERFPQSCTSALRPVKPPALRHLVLMIDATARAPSQTRGLAAGGGGSRLQTRGPLSGVGVLTLDPRPRCRGWRVPTQTRGLTVGVGAPHPDPRPHCRGWVAQTQGSHCRRQRVLTQTRGPHCRGGGRGRLLAWKSMFSISAVLALVTIFILKIQRTDEESMTRRPGSLASTKRLYSLL